MKKLLTLAGVVMLLTFVLAACTRPGATSTTHNDPPNTVTTVQVTLADFKVETATTTFTPGQSYLFQVTNNGSIAHEFMIVPAAIAKSMGSMPTMDMSSMDKQALAYVENIGPGETKTLTYTFPTSTANTQNQFACFYPGHYQAGMHTNVQVSKKG